MPGLPLVASNSERKRFCPGGTPRDGDGEEVVDDGDVVAGVEIGGGGGIRGLCGIKAAGTAMVNLHGGEE